MISGTPYLPGLMMIGSMVSTPLPNAGSGSSSMKTPPFLRKDMAPEGKELTAQRSSKVRVRPIQTDKAISNFPSASVFVVERLIL